MRLNSGGELETLQPDDWLALRERMRAVQRAGALTGGERRSSLPP